MEWQPIETAPKNGTTFLGYVPAWRDYVARQDVCPMHWSGWGGGIWESSTSGHRIHDEVTHWMPLPAPPGGKVASACPCGRTPTSSLQIADAGQGGKWATVSSDCCGEWKIEFRTNYAALDSDECRRLAREAWNAAPRKDEQVTQQVQHHNLLNDVLRMFPLGQPNRISVSEDGKVKIAEWQYLGRYFEIEDAGDGTLSLMVSIDDKCTHWILKPCK